MISYMSAGWEKLFFGPIGAIELAAVYRTTNALVTATPTIKKTNPTCVRGLVHTFT